MTTKERAALNAAINSEGVIATEAEVIRADAKSLTPELFLRLWPLLCLPIPEGFIRSIGAIKGKPYESTGISSVQVQIDRMNNVLTPLWWHDHVEYSDEGRVAHVEVHVRDGAGDGEPLIVREAWGGVNQGSTTGNIYKGSYTNAAKVAYARLGPGHEVYLGATDFDPDTDEQTATQQVKPTVAGATGAGVKKITRTRAEGLVKAAVRAGVLDRLQLAAAHVHGDDVGDCSTEENAVKALIGLNVDEANRTRAWIDRKAEEALNS